MSLTPIVKEFFVPETSSSSSEGGHEEDLQWVRSSWHRQDLGAAEESFIAVSALLRFQRLIIRTLEIELKPLRLNLTDFSLLMMLVLSDSGTELMSGLARGLMVHAATATLATDRLEARGLIARSPHPTDRRATEVSITEDGRMLALRAAAILGEIEYGLGGGRKDDRRDLIELLARLRTPDNG
jgi:DNA-binding MarR family transcriptional regulator